MNGFLPALYTNLYTLVSHDELVSILVYSGCAGWVFRDFDKETY